MEERLRALTFIMMAIGALYAFDGISQGALSGSQVTGLAVFEQQAAGCDDSDNRDYLIQGLTSAQLFAANGEGPKSDVCEGDTLIEYYCVFDEPQVEFHECENGCSDGACAQ